MKITLVIVVVLLSLTTLSSLGYTGQMEIPREYAMRALLGEARGEGYEGMLAVGEVLRRNPKTPFYGASKISNEGEKWYALEKNKKVLLPSSLVKKAERAWDESQKSNTTNNATNFESVNFKTPYWAKNMKEVARIGKHIFYQ